MWWDLDVMSAQLQLYTEHLATTAFLVHMLVTIDLLHNVLRGVRKDYKVQTT